MNNEPTDVNDSTESSPVKTEEVPQAEAESAPVEDTKADEPQAQPDESTETGEAPKKGAEARIRELNAEKKAEREKRIGLEQKLAELTGSVEPSAPRAPYTPQVEAGTEVSPEQYRHDVQQSAMSAAQLLIAQNNAVHRIDSEAKQITRDYPQLDPSSDQYDKELSDSVTEATVAYVQGQPYTASPRKFVDRLMKPYQRSVTREVGEETVNIAKQVAGSATRPTSVTTSGGKSDDELSIKELEKKYGIEQF